MPEKCASALNNEMQYYERLQIHDSLMHACIPGNAYHVDATSLAPVWVYVETFNDPNWL